MYELISNFTPQVDRDALPTVYVIARVDGRQGWLAWLTPLSGLNLKIFGSARAFLEAYANGPGCLVFDAGSKHAEDVDLFQELRARCIDLPAIVLTGVYSCQPRADIEHGTPDEFPPTRFDGSKLVKHVRIAVERNMSEREKRRAADEKAKASLRLTEIEREVMVHLLSGRTEEEIARRLALDVAKAKELQAEVLRKLGMRNLDELIAHVLHSNSQKTKGD
jgi:FixJ family two-component response regulator